MSDTRYREYLEGPIVHIIQTYVKGTIKEHHNSILELWCKSKRGARRVALGGMESELVPTEPSQTYPTTAPP